jgi:hypothetical protein
MNLDFLEKTGHISIEYYKQEVPFPDEQDKLMWLSTLPSNIAANFAEYSLEKLMLNIPFLAYYIPKFVGTLDDYVVAHLSPDEAAEYLKIAMETKRDITKK